MSRTLVDCYLPLRHLGARLGGRLIGATSRLALFGMTLTVALTAQPAAAQLLGHWAFDDGIGLIAQDSTAGSNFGTLRNTTNGGPVGVLPTWVSGKIGPNALNFHGGASGSIRSYVDVGSTSDFNVAAGDGFSRFVWVNPSGTSNAAFQGIFTQRADSNQKISIFVNSSDQLYFELNDGSGASFNATSSLTLADGDWQLVGVSRDSSGVVKGWLNGNEVTLGTSLTAAMTLGAQQGPQFGRHSLSDAQYFDGLLDDASIWGSGFTEGQAKALYNLGNEADFGYNASEVAQLLELASGDSPIDILGRVWTFADELSTPLGVPVFDNDGNVFLMLADGGTGVASFVGSSAVVPEPSSLFAFVVCLLAALAVGRRVKRQRM